LGNGNGEFDRPAGIWLDSKSNVVYVADTNNNRIQQFDINGKFIAKGGQFGEENGQFNNPASVGVSPITGHVFVVDSSNKRVQQFDRGANLSRN
jgi:tripartite motif-containing protein 71